MDKHYCGGEEFSFALERIQAQFAKMEWTPEIIFGINRGGLVPSVYLSHFYNVPHEVLNIRLRDFVATDGWNGMLESAVWADKKILIVDDIYDSGKTISKVKELAKFEHANPEIKVATIFVAGDEKRDDLDVFALRVPKGTWVVFPWEKD